MTCIHILNSAWGIASHRTHRIENSTRTRIGDGLSFVTNDSRKDTTVLPRSSINVSSLILDGINHCNGFNVFHRTNNQLIFQVFLRPHINGGFYLYNLLNGGNHNKCILSVCHQSFKSCIIWLKLTQAELLPQVETHVYLILLRTDMWLKVTESPAQSPILDLLVLI